MSEEEEKICEHCGSVNPMGATSCEHCGSKVFRKARYIEEEEVIQKGLTPREKSGLLILLLGFGYVVFDLMFDLTPFSLFDDIAVVIFVTAIWLVLTITEKRTVTRRKLVP
jgi:ribosomal protein L40E